MKIFYSTLCSIALSTLTFIATAQTSPEEKEYSNDVGFNTTFLLEGIINSGQTPFTLMYKKYKDNNNPLRLGVRINANLTNTKENSPSNFANQSSFSFSGVVGKEFQKEINRNWIWYYGGDLIPSFIFSKLEYSNNNGYNQTTIDNRLGIGIMPFLGVRFNINSKLYLSTEFSFGPSYSYTWTKREEGYPGNISNTDLEVGRFNFSMNPAYGLFLYYRF